MRNASCFAGGQPGLADRHHALQVHAPPHIGIGGVRLPERGGIAVVAEAGVVAGVHCWLASDFENRKRNSWRRRNRAGCPSKRT